MFSKVQKVMVAETSVMDVVPSASLGDDSGYKSLHIMKVVASRPAAVFGLDLAPASDIDRGLSRYCANDSEPP